MTYALHVNLQGRRVVVVGGGAVAARRVPALINEGADVLVVAPTIQPSLKLLADDGLLKWLPRDFDRHDLAGAWLVQIATTDPHVNAAAADEARQLGIWAVRADDASLSDALTPATATLGDVSLSVLTGDPRRTKVIRDRLAAGVRDGSLDARPRRARTRGSVVLIGGGPGDPDLITVRGRRELLTADVIVHDRLAPRELLDLVDPDVELIDAGKSPGDHVLSQEEINAVIVDRARAGLRVARLKGGDSFVFGRGSEEILACMAADIAVEVVPGVASAISAPAAAGIPVTHRGTSTGFIVISGHVAQDLSAVAETGLTTVVLMGMATLGLTVDEFIRAGRQESTPVAVIHRAYQPEQRVVTGTLSSICALVEREGIGSPAVIVIGDVVDVIPQVASVAQLEQLAS